MAWLEIIEIRAVGSNQILLESRLQDLLDELNQETSLLAVKVYSHVLLQTDFSIHLFHASPKADRSCSPICARLIPSLKGFGLVNHTVWVEKSNGS